MKIKKKKKKKKKKNEKLAVVVRVPQTTQGLVISHCCSAKDSKETYKDLERTCTAIVAHKTFCLVTFSLPPSSGFALVSSAAVFWDVTQRSPQRTKKRLLTSEHSFPFVFVICLRSVE